MADRYFEPCVCMCGDTVPYCRIYYVSIIKYSTNTVISLVDNLNSSRYSTVIFNSAKTHNARTAITMARSRLDRSVELPIG